MLGGQYFSNWSEKLHVCDPFPIPEGWIKFRMMDWGSYRPYGVLWGAADYDGCIWIYRELYGYGGKPNIGTKESSRTVAQKIADAESQERSNIQYGVLDNACWGKQDTGAPSVAEEINRVLLFNGCRPFGPCTKGREYAGEEIRLRLEGYKDSNGDQVPALKIFRNCYHLIRTLPELTHDRNNPEKYDTNGEDHLCFVGDTLITTMRGLVKIKDVTTDDYVLTRKGYKKVVACGLTAHNADVVTIVSNGKTLTGTGNHPIFTNKGIYPLDKLSYGSIIYYNGGNILCQENNQKQQTALYSTESHLGDTLCRQEHLTEGITELTEDLEKKELGICTERYGNIITEKYQKASTFIIRTKTLLTTVLKTLSCYLDLSICQNTLSNITRTKNTEREQKNNSTQSENLPLSGTVLKKEENGTLNTARKLQQSNILCRKSLSLVYSVENNTKLFRKCEIGQSSAQELATLNIDEMQELMTKQDNVLSAESHLELTDLKTRCVVVESVVENCYQELEKADVYNITVDEVHEYFANGFLVHNCDSLAYGLLSRPYKAERPKERDAWEFDEWQDAPAPESGWGI